MKIRIEEYFPQKNSHMVVVKVMLFATLFLFNSLKAYSQIYFSKTYQENTNIQNVWQTIDRGYIAGGISQRWDSSSGIWNYDHYILKTDSMGNVLWENNYDFTILDGNCIEGSIVRELDNGEYVYISSINCAQNPPSELSKYLLIRLKSNGDTLWTKTYERPKRSMGQWVEPTSDGGFVMTGYAADFGTSADVYIVKADSVGNEAWRKAYQLYGEDQGACVRQTSDGGFIVAAGSVYSYPEVHTWLLKLNSAGDTVWTKKYPWGMWNVNAFIDITPDNGFIIAVKDSAYYQVALKTDSLGDLLWMRNFGEGNGCIAQNVEGGFSLFSSNSFVKIDQNGNELFQKPNSLNPKFWQQTNDGGYIAAKDNQLIKTDCSSNYTYWDVSECPLSSVTIENYLSLSESIYPNPSSGIFNVVAGNNDLLEIYNCNGQLIRKMNLDASKVIDLSMFEKGLYFVKMIGESNASITKIIIE